MATGADPRSSWPRLTAALARYTNGPAFLEDDLADAAETIGDYEIWRATIAGKADPTFVTLGRVIGNAAAERHRWKK